MVNPAEDNVYYTIDHVHTYIHTESVLAHRVHCSLVNLLIVTSFDYYITPICLSEVNTLVCLYITHKLGSLYIHKALLMMIRKCF